MDDIVVKTKDRATLIQDLEETFPNLHKINLKLNPEKCVFGVPFGMLLGFFVSHRGLRPMMTHKYRGSIVVLSISKSVEPNEELKEIIISFQ